MYEELRNRFFVQNESELLINENNTILMEYFEDVLQEADDFARKVIDLVYQNSNITDEEMQVILEKYENLFKSSRWSFVEVSFNDNN